MIRHKHDDGHHLTWCSHVTMMDMKRGHGLRPFPLSLRLRLGTHCPCRLAFLLSLQSVRDGIRQRRCASEGHECCCSGSTTIEHLYRSVETPCRWVDYCFGFCFFYWEGRGRKLFGLGSFSRSAMKTDYHRYPFVEKLLLDSLEHVSRFMGMWCQSSHNPFSSPSFCFLAYAYTVCWKRPFPRLFFLRLLPVLYPRQRLQSLLITPWAHGLSMVMTSFAVVLWISGLYVFQVKTEQYVVLAVSFCLFRL